MSEIINHYNMPIPRSIPDHSVLLSVFDVSISIDCSNSQSCPNDPCYPNINQKLPPKIKNKKNDSSFMCSPAILNEINETIAKIENMQLNQHSLNQLYSQIYKYF